MRKVSYIVIMIILYVAQIGCSTNWDEKYNEFPFETCENTSLSVSNDSLYFQSEASVRELNISTESYWTATSSANWIQLSESRAKGNATLTISVSENKSPTEQRKGSVIISNGIETVTVYVEQGNMVEQLQLDKFELTFPYYGGSNQVIVKANVAWTAISNDSWISVTKNEAGTAVAIDIQRNAKIESRQGYFTIHGVEKTYTVNVIQEAAPEVLYPNNPELYFPYHGGSNHVLITANTVWSVSSDVTWISTKKNDAGTAFAVELQPNESASVRQGTIIIKGVNLVCTVSVTQEGAPEQLQLSPTQLPPFPPHGGSNQVLVSANTDWSVRSDVTWISVIKNDYNTAFAVMCEPNDITESRSGVILVSTAANTYIVKVSQEPMIERIVLDKTNLEFPYHGGSNQVIVDANVSWNVYSADSWIKVEKNKENTAFAVYPQSNESALDRSTIITVTGVRESRVVSVLQKGKR